MADNKIHIYIQPWNSEKIRSLAQSFNVSVSTFVNTYFEKVTEDHLIETMTQIIRDELKVKKELKVKLDDKN